MQQLQSQIQAKFFQNKGQTLVEVLAGIALFIFGTVAFLYLLNSYFISFKNVKDRMIANLLAQEGLELVIGKRNENIARISNGETINWLEGLGDIDQASTTICLDYKMQQAQTSQNPCSLYIDNNSFSHSITSTSTQYSRKIILNSLNNTSLQNSTSVEVISIV
ncbi:MAG: type IV pilus modification PilV family protein, partial [Minisyncoccia bacterium]